VFGWNSRKLDRNVFPFFDGKVTRKVDPLMILDRITTSGFDMQEDMQAVLNDDEDATRKFMKMVRQVFNVRQYEDGGLTNLECSDMFDEFVTFIYELKKKRGLTQKPQQRSESKSSDQSTTPPDSGSTSTPKESKTKERQPSSAP
jgi:hypothetical protein